MNIEEKRKIEEMYEKGLVEISSIIEPLIENFKIDRCSIDIQQCQLVIDYLIRDRDFDENYIQQLEEELEKEKEKNKNAYRKANNYLYFNDGADYEVALWEVIRTLRPDLAKKWDNGECADLKYIREE